MPELSIKSFLLSHVKPFRVWIFLIFLVSLVCAFDLSFRPYVLKIIIDKLTHTFPERVARRHLAAFYRLHFHVNLSSSGV